MTSRYLGERCALSLRWARMRPKQPRHHRPPFLPHIGHHSKAALKGCATQLHNGMAMKEGGKREAGTADGRRCAQEELVINSRDVE